MAVSFLLITTDKKILVTIIQVIGIIILIVTIIIILMIVVNIIMIVNFMVVGVVVVVVVVVMAVVITIYTVTLCHKLNTVTLCPILQSVIHYLQQVYVTNMTTLFLSTIVVITNYTSTLTISIYVDVLFNLLSSKKLPDLLKTITIHPVLSIPHSQEWYYGS